MRRQEPPSALPRLTGLGRGRVRPLAWCSRARTLAALPVGAPRYNLPLLVPRFARKHPSARPRRRIRKLRLFSLLLLLFLLGGVSFTFGLITAVAGKIPELDPARLQKQEVDGYIYAGSPRNRVLAVLRGSESRIIDPPNKISPRIKHAIIAVEDKRFY